MTADLGREWVDWLRDVREQAEKRLASSGDPAIATEVLDLLWELRRSLVAVGAVTYLLWRRVGRIAGAYQVASTTTAEAEIQIARLRARIAELEADAEKTPTMDGWL